MLVEEFTSNVEYYMALSDFFIGKPGPGSISEALQFHLPVIVECNAKTLPQERYNAQWVTEKGFGIVVSSFREIALTVQRLFEGSTFEELRRNVGAYSNRALFEVPMILEKIHRQARASLEVNHEPGRNPHVVLSIAEEASLQEVRLHAPAEQAD